MYCVQVREVVIGEGKPKICVPLVARTIDELVREAEVVAQLEPDLVEWRVDFLESLENGFDLTVIFDNLKTIRNKLGNLPLIFTFRTAREGGEREISPEQYVQLNMEALTSGYADLIDVELFSPEADVSTLIQSAHQYGVKVILSNHDFDKTPRKAELINRLRKAQELGGDLPKIAVMPQSTADVLTLLQATWEMNELYADRPIITMSMAGKGVISRLSGEIFGSAVTFGSAGKASAPGQVAVAELRQMLELLHQSQQ
ncbi:type I 3-dehydroquinate dehydratase [Paenibacillus silvae]